MRDLALVVAAREQRVERMGIFGDVECDRFALWIRVLQWGARALGAQRGKKAQRNQRSSRSSQDKPRP